MLRESEMNEWDENCSMSQRLRNEAVKAFEAALKEAQSAGEGSEPGSRGAKREAARAWAAAASRAEPELAKAMAEAALSLTFAGPKSPLGGDTARALMLAFDSRPEGEKEGLLGALGGAHKDEGLGVLPLSCWAGSARYPELAEAVAGLSEGSLLALGAGASPDRPALAAAQLCAAASANAKAGEAARAAARAQLKRFCDQDEEAAGAALLSLAGDAKWDDPDLARLDPALYKEAFEGKSLGRGPLLHALARHCDGQAVVDWCQKAGFKGAAWPASPVACLMRMEDWSPPEGLAECSRDVVLGYPEEARRALEGLEGPWEGEREALAESMAAFPHGALRWKSAAPAFFEAVFGSEAARAAAWRGWERRERGLIAAFEGREVMAKELTLGPVALARAIGFEEAAEPGRSKWAALAEAELAALRAKPRMSDEEGRAVAEIERALMAPSRAPKGARRSVL